MNHASSLALEVDALPADGEESMPVAPKEVDQAAAVLCTVVLEC